LYGDRIEGSGNMRDLNQFMDEAPMIGLQMSSRLACLFVGARRTCF
jgi:hypothetical protein